MARTSPNLNISVTSETPSTINEENEDITNFWEDD